MLPVLDRTLNPCGRTKPGGSTTNNVVAMIPAGALVCVPLMLATWLAVTAALTSSCHTMLAPSSTITFILREAIATAAVNVALKDTTERRIKEGMVIVQSAPGAGFATCRL